MFTFGACRVVVLTWFCAAAVRSLVFVGVDGWHLIAYIDFVFGLAFAVLICLFCLYGTDG